MVETSEKKWYVLHTYSGYEEKVKKDLLSRAQSMGMQNYIFRVIVPEEQKTETVRGKKQEVDEKVFPGYVLVEMVMTDESWYVVRNTNGVTGFVGVGSDPIPMEDEEVKNIFEVIGLDLTEEEKELKEVIKINFAVGDYVKVLKGGFADQEGKVAEIDMEHKKAKVMIEMFGRMTPVEVDFDSIQKAN